MQPLGRLPILTKAEMMEHFDDLVTDRAVRLEDAEAFLHDDPGTRLYLDSYVVLSTSGSTGRRGVFLFDPDEWLTAVAMIARPIGWAGQRVGFRAPRTAMIASTTPWHYSARVSASLDRLLPSLHLTRPNPRLLVRQLNEWQPEVLAVYPSVLQLADEQTAGRSAFGCNASPRAEVLPDQTRRRVRKPGGCCLDTRGDLARSPPSARRAQAPA